MSAENHSTDIAGAEYCSMAPGVVNDDSSRPPSHGLTVWLTGISSSGKTTIARGVYGKILERKLRVEWLDGDRIRQTLSKGLGYSREDRNEHIRRIGFVADLLTRNGVVVLVSAIAPYRDIRTEMRAKIKCFLEVYVHAPLQICEQRDINGIYRRYRAGKLRGVTGLDDPYEPPLDADVECRTDLESISESVDKVTGILNARLHNL